MSLIFKAFVFLSLVCVTFAASWEGEWMDSDGQTMYLCEENGMVQGMYPYGSIQMKISKWDWNYITGQYFGGGLVFGGYRVNQRQFTHNQGRGNATLSADGQSMTAWFSVKGQGARMKFMSSFTLSATLVTSTLTDRVAQCGIIDWTATDMIEGSYTMTDATMEACMTNGMSESSYSWTTVNGTFMGINYGKCMFNGQVCGSDWFEMSLGYFGVSTMWKLMDGRVYEYWFAGATPQLLDMTDMTNHGSYWWTSVASTGASCMMAESEFYNPLKCSVMTDEFCSAQEWYGLCTLNSNKVHASSNTSCYKTEVM